MEEELETWLHPNNTDHLDDFVFNPSGWDIAADLMLLFYACAGLIADILIIYMIARNVRMRSKTNVLLMNFAINDACCIISNVRILADLMQLIGRHTHTTAGVNCAIQFMDMIFQLNQTLFLLILISNTLIKSKRIQVKWLLVAVYTFMVVNFLLDQLYCEYQFWPFLVVPCIVMFLLNVGVLLFKEVNNCYKKWYKKDPLSEGTLFRLTIGRIYIASWFLSSIFYEVFHNILSTLIGHQCFMTSMYILIYIISADKTFKICILNMLRCKGADVYDVNATIRFAEDSCDEDQHQININFDDNTTRVPVQ